MLLQSKTEGYWCPPKGRIEFNETEYECAIQETEEETGLTKTDYTIFDDQSTTTVTYLWRNKHEKTVTFWNAKMVDNEKTIKLSKEHSNFKWFDANEAIQKVYKRLPNLAETFKCICDENK